MQFGATVTDVVNGAHAVRGVLASASDGTREQFRADWLIDASGGRSDLARSDQFRRSIVPLAHVDVPGGVDRNGVPFRWEQLPHRAGVGHGITGANGAFAINDALAGTMTAYVPWPEQSASSPLELLGIDASGRVASGRFVARQQLAPIAAQGRVLLAGDSVGTVLPATQMGVSLAIDDAVAAARTILDASADAVAEYDILARTMRTIQML
jgi:flavin-dependent dehydrogenase